MHPVVWKGEGSKCLFNNAADRNLSHSLLNMLFTRGSSDVNKSFGKSKSYGWLYNWNKRLMNELLWLIIQLKQTTYEWTIMVDYITETNDLWMN